MSCNVSDIDLELLHTWLSESYWAQDRNLDRQKRAIEGSINFVALKDRRMVGFARVVTDKATFAWLCDVIVDPEKRREGIGKLLVAAATLHPDLQAVGKIVLATRNAHGLYEGFGFGPVPEGRFMIKPMG